VKPLVPATVDLRDFPYMPVDVQRLLTSETWLLGSGDERAAAMTLWLASWHQVPAGSLPDNERMLEHLSQVKKWKKVSAHVMRGWTKADDGRYYHPVVAEKALEAWLDKLAQRLSSGSGNAKRWKVEFDPAPIEDEMREARRLLTALNPQSRRLTKRKPPGIPIESDAHPEGNTDGTADGIPTGLPPGIPSGSQERGRGKEKEEQKNSEPNGSGAGAPTDNPPDPIWGSGLAFLRRKGIPDKPARGLLGQLRKAAGDIQTGAILAQAEAQDISEPAAWLMAAAAAKARAGPVAVIGKTEAGLMDLQELIDGNALVASRNRQGDAEALRAVPGTCTRIEPAGRRGAGVG
jgi:hypothetical protein